MKKFVCKIFGHKLTLITKNTLYNEVRQCSNCQQKFTATVNGQLVKLNSSWEENNMLFDRLVEKYVTQTS